MKKEKCIIKYIVMKRQSCNLCYPVNIITMVKVYGVCKLNSIVWECLTSSINN